METMKGFSEVGMSSAGQRRWTGEPFIRTTAVSEAPMGGGGGWAGKTDQENHCAAGALCWLTVHPTLLAS